MAARPHDGEEPRDGASRGDDGHEPGTGGDDRSEPTGPPSDEDVDRQWQEIVARLEDVPELEDPTSDPAHEPDPDVDGSHGRHTGPAPSEPQPPRVVRPAAAPDNPRSWVPDPAVEEAEDHFEPPDPGPVLGGDPLLTMAWAAVISVPLLALLAVVLWRDLPSVVLQVAGVVFLGGVGLLLWRMPHDRDDDSGPGAIV